MAFKYETERTIDHERNAWLVCDRVVTHIDPEFHEFSFYWHDERMKLDAISELSNTDNPGPQERSDVHWRFMRVGIPEHMEDQRKEILAMIEEALKTYGAGHGERFVKTVTAEFIPFQPP